GLAEQLVGKLRRTIERLHEAGAATVHVVTDHGFLLLPADMVNGLGKPSVPEVACFNRAGSWAALKPDAPAEGVVKCPLALASEEMMLGFPRGVRTLLKTGDFLHGGIALQEAVVPHLLSLASLAPARPEVEVTVTTDKIQGGTVPVVIRPSGSGQGQLGG